MHELRIVRRGRRRLIPITELNHWIERNAHRTLGDRQPGLREPTLGSGDDLAASSAGVEQGASSWRDSSRVPAHLRDAHDRRGRQRKALQTLMGHPSITVTIDRYGHLFRGSEEHAAVLLDSYLAEAHARAREAEIEACGNTVGKITAV